MRHLTTRSKLGVILLISVLLRIGAAFYLGNEVVAVPGAADQFSYHNLALRLLGGYGFTFDRAWWPLTRAGEPTAHWSYIYTSYLAVVYAVFGAHPLVARLIQAIAVGLLQPYLTYRLAKQLFASFQGKLEISDSFVERVSLLSAFIAAIYIYFVYYAATLMTEPFFITAVLGCITLTISLANQLAESTYRRRAIELGLVLSIAILLRQLFLLFIPFLMLWLILFAYRQYLRSYVGSAIFIITIILAGTVLPITLFNYARFGEFVLLNTNAGFAFYWGNHPIHGTQFIPASEMGAIYKDLIPFELRNLDEAELDRALLKLGIQFVLDEPGRYIRLTISRIPAYFKFWPDSGSNIISNISRVGSFGLFLPFILYGLVRPFLNLGRLPQSPLFRWPSAQVLLLYLFILVYAVIHVLSWALVRYRLPVDAIFVVFAAWALVDLGALSNKLFQATQPGKQKISIMEKT